MNIGSSFLLIPIVNTFMKQNCRIHTILVLLELHRSLRQSTKPRDSVMFVVLTSPPTQYTCRSYGRLFYRSKESTNSIKIGLLNEKTLQN